MSKAILFNFRSRAGQAKTAAGSLLLSLMLALGWPLQAQELSYLKGQSIAAAYEGWVERPDGSRAFLFGYFNRNWEETPDIPVGPANFFAPGPRDQGQPTRFLPRRNRFVFEIPVPDDFTVNDELVWTLEAGGEVSTAYATLQPDYFLDNVAIMSETGALLGGISTPEIRANTPPELTLEGLAERFETRVGEPVVLSVFVTDDGQPVSLRGLSEEQEAAAPINPDGSFNLEEALRKPRRGTVGKQNGLHHSWFVYRGPDSGEANFDPPQISVWEDFRPWTNSPWASFWEPPALPDDDRWIARVTFDSPGTYVLRGRADDGGLWTDVDVVVEVRPLDR
jgi:hypothetical protein